MESSIQKHDIIGPTFNPNYIPFPKILSLFFL